MIHAVEHEKCATGCFFRCRERVLLCTDHSAVSPQFIHLLFTTYDKRREGAISFDLFVQSCIGLKRMTDVFKKYDDDRDGFITLSFEDFLTEILKQN